MKSNPQALLLVNPRSEKPSKSKSRQKPKTKTGKTGQAKEEKKVARKKRTTSPKARRGYQRNAVAKKQRKRTIPKGAPSLPKSGRRALTQKDLAWDKYVPTLGKTREAVQKKYGTLSAARQAYLALTREAREAKQAKKRSSRSASQEQRRLAGFERRAKNISKFLGLTPKQAAAQYDRVSDLDEAIRFEREREQVAKQKRTAARKKKTAAKRRETAERKEARAARRSRALPKGTKKTALPGYDTIDIPPAPGPLYRGPRGQLVEPSTWRRPIVGQQDPGWYYYPPTEGGYKFVKNPKNSSKKKKSKKKAQKKSWVSKMPIIGNMMKKSRRKGRKGKKNPQFSAGRVLKLTGSALGGYVGGNVVGGVGSSVATRFTGTSSLLTRAAGAAATLGAAHMVVKGSTEYYAPVMSGAGLAAAQTLMGWGAVPESFGGMGYQKPIAQDPYKTKKTGGTGDKLYNMIFGNGGMKGMGFVPSDDDLLSSINSLDEYVDVPLEEYVDVPLDEYVDVPLEEYVDVPLEEYVDVPMEEYVDVPMDGYEELAGEMSPEPDFSFVADDPTIPMDGYEELAGDDDIALSSSEEKAYALAEDYTTQIPGLDYGSLTSREAQGYGGAHRSLVGYEELAEDFEELAGLGASPKLSRAAKAKATRMRRVAGGKTKPTQSEQKTAQVRQRAVSQGGRAGWLRKLARSIDSRISVLDSRIDRLESRVGGRSSGGGAAPGTVTRDPEGAKQIRSVTQKAILEATQNTAYETGSRGHFRATFQAFAKRMGQVGDPEKRAFLVAYRAATRGPEAAVQAAKRAGLSKSAIQGLATSPAKSVQTSNNSRAQAGCTDIVTLPGGGLARKVPKTYHRYGKVRKAGCGEPAEFGGIFAKSLFGRRGRWE